jgi:hypothetical protein
LYYIYISRFETIKKEKMKRILKNIKTSVMGSIAGLSLIVDAIGKKDWALAIGGAATMILGLLAKDSDVQ